MVTLLTVLFVLICPLLIFIVLVQDPKGGGLAGVLGGAGGGSAFGAKTADRVMQFTVILGVVFFAMALALGFKLRSEEALVPSLKEPAPIGAGAAAPGQTPAAAPAEAPGAATPAAPGTPPSAPAGESAPATQPAAPADAPGGGGGGG